MRELWISLSVSCHAYDALTTCGQNDHGVSRGSDDGESCARKAAVTGAIVGARNARQAEGVMCAGEVQLSDEEVTEIGTLLIRAAD